MNRFIRIPHSVRILLTRRCNLKCSFCLNDAKGQALQGELTTSEWLTFFERLKELKVFNIDLSGGEIFLRDDLFILLKKLRENQMHRLTLLTNGTLITKDFADRLNQLKIKNISISVDGIEETHDQIRGTGNFKKTMTGIRNLIATGIIPLVSFTPIRSNYKDLGSLIDILVALGIASVQVNTLSPEGRCLNIYHEIVPKYPGQIKEILEIVDRKRKEYPGFKITNSMGFYYYLSKSYEYYKKEPGNYKLKHLKDGCGAASTSCTITATGDVIPCEGLFDFKGGNIKEKDLLDIWSNSEHFKTIRDLASIAMDQVPFCKECKYIYLCDGGCRAMAYILYNDLLAPTCSCPFWQKGLAPPP